MMMVMMLVVVVVVGGGNVDVTFLIIFTLLSKFLFQGFPSH
jgi:hypothetical protein